jgi:hypothetical protein
VQVEFAVHKRHQAPLTSDDSIRVLFKPHYNVSAAALQQLQSEVESGQFPFPTDGLVFTPTAMPYALGMQQQLIKWQPLQQMGADLTGRQLHEGSFSCNSYSAFESCAGLSSCAGQKAASDTRSCLKMLPRGLVYECIALSADHVSKQQGMEAAGTSTSSATTALLLEQQEGYRPRMAVWVPQSVRWDKAVENDLAVLENLRDRLRRPAFASISHEQLLQAVKQVQELVGETACVRDAVAAGIAASGSSSSSSSSSVGHPARSMPFQQLYAALSEAVASGAVERSVEPASGLEVYCYRLSEPPSSAVAAMCRGLVLHADSETVVATPFVRFDHLNKDQVGLQTQVCCWSACYHASWASSQWVQQVQVCARL